MGNCCFQSCIIPLIEKNEIGGACSAYGGERRVQVLAGKPERKNHWDDPGLDGKIIGRLIFQEVG
jgi:hypothetical protein